MSTSKTKPAVQLVLGSQAATFPLTVTVKKLDGTEAALTLTCKAIRKTAWAKVRDEHYAKLLSENKPAAAERADAAADAEPTGTRLQAIVTQGLQSDAGLVLQFATAWDLSEDLNRDNLQALEDEFGGSMSQIISGFEVAIYQGRLGN